MFREKHALGCMLLRTGSPADVGHQDFERLKGCEQRERRAGAGRSQRLSSGPRPGARSKEPSWRPDAVTPGQKFGTEERDNPVSFGMAKGLASKAFLSSGFPWEPVPLLHLYETETLFPACCLLTRPFYILHS